MSKSPIKSITVNIIEKYTDEEWSKIWTDFYWKVEAEQLKTKKNPPELAKTAEQ